MDRAAMIACLRQHESELKLFGSVARNEAGPGSDVDLFFDYRSGRFGLYDLMDVKAAASRILGRPTDIMTRDSLHKRIRAAVEAAAVPVF